MAGKLQVSINSIEEFSSRFPPVAFAKTRQHTTSSSVAWLFAEVDLLRWDQLLHGTIPYANMPVLSAI